MCVCSVVDVYCCCVVSMQMLHVMLMFAVAVVWVLCSVCAVLLMFAVAVCAE